MIAIKLYVVIRQQRVSNNEAHRRTCYSCLLLFTVWTKKSYES